jgi:uncharacterized protein (TIGR03437 family)
MQLTTPPSAFPEDPSLTTSFSGVSIQVGRGAASVNGWASVWVTFNGKSNPSTVFIVHDSPGIFTFTGTGIGPVTVQNALSGGVLVSNSNQASAARRKAP